MQVVGCWVEGFPLALDVDEILALLRCGYRVEGLGLRVEGFGV